MNSKYSTLPYPTADSIILFEFINYRICHGAYDIPILQKLLCMGVFRWLKAHHNS